MINGGLSRMRIAIGIPTFNRSEVLLKTLEDVLRQDFPADEIIVVDQSDWYPEGARERIKALAAKGVIRYFRQETPNLPTARNRVLRETVCDIVIFIDDDVELAPGFVAAHAANFQEESVWAVCGGFTERDIAVRPIVPRTWAKVLDYRRFDPGWNIRIEDFGTLKGCNHAVRRSAVLALGGYDEGYTGVALAEETDLAMRILRAGGRIVFDPKARLHHLRAPAGGCRVAHWGDLSAATSCLRFVRKHWRRLGWSASGRELWHCWRLGVFNRKNALSPSRMLHNAIALIIASFDGLRSS
jgi:GT2 family glycosyltransferase